MHAKSGERTLLASVLMSSPGPIVLGLALLFGRSSTQLADFVRRTAELAAIVVSWAVFRLLRRGGGADAERRRSLVRAANSCVGAAMCLSGTVMLLVALFAPEMGKGNVVPGLVIAVLGVTTNSWFWLRYHQLNREQPDAILAVQSKLYRAKSLVDACVTVALAVVAVAPGAPAARVVDLGGSVIVAAYLVVNGMITVRVAGTAVESGSLTSPPDSVP